jgi:hypothetical protein
MKKALVLALVFTFGLGIAAFAGPLSGSWCTDIEITIYPDGFMIVSDFESKLIVDYTVCGWVFGSESVFELGGWTEQSFTADSVLGAFTFDSYLEFNPADATFTEWDSNVGVSIAGVAFDAEFLLTGTGAGWAFGASSGAGDCDFGANVYFNSEMTTAGLVLQTDSYCFCFTSVDFEISFPFACIDLVDVSIGFSSAGFDGITFSVSGIVVPGIAWLTFDVDLSFYADTLGGKVMTLTPKIDLGDWLCIELFYDLITDGTYNIEGINFWGLELDYTWNGVSFLSKSVFDWPTHFIIAGADLDDFTYNEVDKVWEYTGDPIEDCDDFYQALKDASYWEVFTISSESDSCCGGAFDFSVSTYFSAWAFNLYCGEYLYIYEPMLFGWGRTDIDVSIGLGSNFDVTLGLSVDVDGFNKATFGFCVTW